MGRYFDDFWQVISTRNVAAIVAGNIVSAPAVVMVAIIKG
jgi:hypothetical protein